MLFLSYFGTSSLSFKLFTHFTVRVISMFLCFVILITPNVETESVIVCLVLSLEVGSESSYSSIKHLKWVIFFKLFYSRQVMFECTIIFSKKIEVKRTMRKQNWMILFSSTAKLLLNKNCAGTVSNLIINNLNQVFFNKNYEVNTFEYR